MSISAVLRLLLLSFALSPVSLPAAQPVPAAPSVPAKAWVLVDFHSGRVLAEQNADERLEPASLTKVMTVYVAAGEIAKGRITLGDNVAVSENAWRTGGSRMFIEPNKPVNVEELLHGIIVQSGNDASVALAEHVSGSTEVFAQLMNQEVKRLGLTGTSFANPEGLPHPENYTTARDMAALGVALIRDHPDIYRIYGTREFTYNGIVQPNRNKTLTLVPGADGIKTGHTEAAGYCLIASAERDGMRLVSVVLGAASDKDRTQASRTLLEYGFRFYESQRPYAAGQKVSSVPLWKGAQPEVELGLEQDLHVLVPRGQYASVQATMDLGAEPVVAPVTRGQRLGTLRLTLEGEVVAERPLVALADVGTGGLWRQGVDSLKLLFE